VLSDNQGDDDTNGDESRQCNGHADGEPSGDRFREVESIAEDHRACDDKSGKE
jgi:hypothetical protein